MKKQKLKTAMWLLILLVMTAFTSYGSNPPDSTNKYSIKQSQHCFDEQKSLGKIILNQDTIIKKQQEKIKNFEFLSDTLFTSNKNLTKINNDNKSVIETKNKWIKGLAYVASTEFIFLVLLLVK